MNDALKGYFSRTTIYSFAVYNVQYSAAEQGQKINQYAVFENGLVLFRFKGNDMKCIGNYGYLIGYSAGDPNANNGLITNLNGNQCLN